MFRRKVVCFELLLWHGFWILSQYHIILMFWKKPFCQNHEISSRPAYVTFLKTGWWNWTHFWWWIPYLKEKEKKNNIFILITIFFNSCWYVWMHHLSMFTIYNSHVKSTLFLLFFFRFQYLSLTYQFWILQMIFGLDFLVLSFSSFLVSGSQIKWHLFCSK